MKKLIVKIFLILFISINLIITTTTANTVPPLAAKGVVLMDGLTGNILFSKNPDVQFEPASTTKIMTALVTLDNTKLEDKVTIGTNPPLADGSSIGISEGQIYTVRELLLGLLLESGNDTAESLAEYVSGSNASFAILMNEKAKELGANNTTFKNPSGLHEEGHLTTAYDLALIMRAAYSNPDFNEIAKTPYYICATNPNYDGSEKWINNRNHCINPDSPYYYEYTYSGKIGYTPEANHTYAASAVKDGQVLISSFLNAEDKNAQFSSVGPLFEYGFKNFETIKLVSEGDNISEYVINDETIIPLLSNKEVYYSKSKLDPVPDVTFKYESENLTKTTLTKGQSLFNGNLLVNGEVYDDLEFISAENREYTYKVVVQDLIKNLTQNKLAITCIVLLFLLITALIVVLFINIKRNRNILKY